MKSAGFSAEVAWAIGTRNSRTFQRSINYPFDYWTLERKPQPSLVIHVWTHGGSGVFVGIKRVLFLRSKGSTTPLVSGFHLQGSNDTFNRTLTTKLFLSHQFGREFWVKNELTLILTALLSVLQIAPYYLNFRAKIIKFQNSGLFHSLKWSFAVWFEKHWHQLCTCILQEGCNRAKISWKQSIAQDHWKMTV